ncbi:MAG: hypothetical protein COA58_04260 [Bacteroidetes bacterium]|nr:MAG: hypothetical protein COA58_04260 [Bacteroidota bacterium]
MKFIQEPRVSLRTNLVGLTIVGSFVIGTIIAAIFFIGGMSTASDSAASNVCVSSASAVNTSSNPFGSLVSGDTILLNGVFRVNNNYTVHSNKAITIIVDGSSARLRIFKNRRLVLGAGSSIILRNGGRLGSTGGCKASAKIFFGSVQVANCSGASGLPSFGSVNTAGGLLPTGSVLPVSWLRVEAESYGEDQVQVKWSTASEENNSHFIIEYSEDAENWIEGLQVGSKAANGMSNTILEYREMHHPPAYLSKLFYRIKQIDFDGEFDYSSVVLFEMKQKDQVVISTLGGSKIKVNVKSENHGESNIRVYSQNGTMVLTDVVEGSKTLSLPKPGIYIIEVGEGADLQRLKHMVL